MSTLAIFGVAAFSQATQTEADSATEQVIAAGINHIDVAPSYGHAEERLGPWLARERDRFFLGCKTQKRTKDAAAAVCHQFVQYGDTVFRREAEALLHQCQERDVGVTIIKSISRGPWGEKPKGYNTWYRPFDDLDHIHLAVCFALSQAVIGPCTASYMSILPLFMEACAKFTAMNIVEQEALIACVSEYEPLFT
jgi:aryl-alcohol dehydrogenase-like predicted oxidoreductase